MSGTTVTRRVGKIAAAGVPPGTSVSSADLIDRLRTIAGAGRGARLVRLIEVGDDAPGFASVLVATGVGGAWRGRRLIAVASGYDPPPRSWPDEPGRLESRWTTEPLPTLCTVDDVLAVLPVRQPGGTAFTLLESRLVVRAFTAMYDAAWARASGPRTGEPLPAELAEVLDRAASGLTDRAAQRALGLSARTHSRRMSELLVLLGAKSRFQAGVEAVRRGLV